MTEEVKTAVEGMGKAFEEFKATYDTRLDSLEKKGTVDPLVEDKIKNLEADMDRLEEINQKLTQAQLEQKSIGEKIDSFETMLKRPEANLTTNDIDTKMQSFDKFIKKGTDGMDEMEKKALTVSDDTGAGYLAPPEYVNELIKTITEITPFRSAARVRTTNQKSVQIPSRTATFTAQWVAEAGTRSETTGYTTALEEIPTHEIYAQVDISNQMLEDSAFNLEAEMQTEFATQFAKQEGNSFIVGDAIGKPQGVITNSNVTTVASGSGTLLTGDGLITLVHSIKSDYGQNASFMFNRTTLGAIRKLKDSAGQYVFQAGMMLTAGVPNSVLGYPYVEAPDLADVGSSAKPVIFGDFSRGYMIVDRVNLSVLRDPFTQASTGNVRYLARRRVGGQVVLPEALVIQVISA